MRQGLGWLMQLAALILLPVALWWGISRGDIYAELLMAAAAMALWIIGRQLRGGPQR